MRKFLIIAASIAALTGAGAAVAIAQPGAAPAPPGATGGPHGFLERLDTNNDNNVSRAEFDAGQTAMFTRLDANRDGSLSEAERRAGRPEGGRGRGPGMRNPDANNDGAVTRDEFLAGPIAMFDRLDANHDGRLTGAERPAERGERHSDRRGGRHHGGGMRGADANQDGVVSQAEYQARGAAMFERMDANKDGQLNTADRDARRANRTPN